MKIFQRLRRQSFTLVELLVVISIIAILAGAALPALQGALVKAQLVSTTGNARQFYIISQSAALDAAQSGTATIGWPGDMSPVPTAPKDYITALVTNDYMKAADLKILIAPGYTLMTSTNIDSFDDTKNNAFNMGAVSDSDDGSAVFLYTKNWTPTSSSGAAASGTIAQNAKPFGDKGFVIFHKGGDGANFKKNFANDTTGMLGTTPSASSPWIKVAATTTQ